MPRQTDINPQAFDLLDDLVGGKVLRFQTVEGGDPRRRLYVVDGQPVDPRIVRELRSIRGQSAIWPDHFDNLPFHVTNCGFAYVRSLAGA